MCGRAIRTAGAKIVTNAESEESNWFIGGHSGLRVSKRCGFDTGCISITFTLQVHSKKVAQSCNMRSTILQVLFFVCCVMGEVVKRSPLEVGLVAFTEKPNKLNDTKMAPLANTSHSHKWIPGHVRHHAYIPAHLHHLYIPTHALVLATETVFVHPQLYNPYRNHIGGFGIGLGMGGHGAGHGFHVVLNF